MGVVYKINQEILDFILSEKQRHPSISCRRLSEIVQERFSVTISKSSINALLKREQLSSPVGRRALPKKKAGKFQIPDQKKTTLFPPREQFIGENKIIQTRATPLSISAGLPRPIPRMGMIFLKAAEWALCGDSLLGGVLSEGHPEQHRPVFALAADQLIYQALFKDQPDPDNFS